ISCGGPLDSKKGTIKSPHNLPGWDEIEVVDIFKKEFNVDVAIQNDANACAIAEWMMGAGVGTENMIFLTFGTGMGAGLILNGKIYSGTNDLGGEVGHVRMADEGPVGFGKAGSFEGFCSGGGIAQLGKSYVQDKIDAGEKVSFCPAVDLISSITAKSIFEAAIEGDKDAVEIVKVSAKYLGVGLSILIDILNPECIVIGSIYARNEQIFKPLIYDVLKKEVIPEALEVCKIVPAKLGDSIGDYAALCVAMQ
ncbi:MAG: ROK family protein, partial [Sinobacterium sp.]|nr:ROK family protein [Sinobacterium sp.]